MLKFAFIKLWYIFPKKRGKTTKKRSVQPGRFLKRF